MTTRGQAKGLQNLVLRLIILLFVPHTCDCCFFSPSTVSSQRPMFPKDYYTHVSAAAPKKEASSSPEKGELVSHPQQSSRPNDCCYYVTDQLLAGEYPGDRRSEEQWTRMKLGAYLDHDITHFIDLTNEGEKNNYDEILREEAQKRGEDVTYKRLPIQDFGVPTKERMKEILEEIDTAISSHPPPKKVYVHCRGGIGRTGTVVGCYLIRRYKLTGDKALEEVNRLFQNSARSAESYYSPETREQMEFVRNWVKEEEEDG